MAIFNGITGIFLILLVLKNNIFNTNMVTFIPYFFENFYDKHLLDQQNNVHKWLWTELYTISNIVNKNYSYKKD